VKPLLNIKVPRGQKLFVFGDVHEHREQFDRLLEEFEKYDNAILISVGDLLEKGFGCSDYLIKKMRKIVDDGKGYIVKGNHELKVIQRNRKKGKLSNNLKWVSRLPLSLSFNFGNGTRVTVTHAGVRPSHTWKDLETNIEVCYARFLDNKDKIIKMKKKIVDGRKITYMSKKGEVWHKKYDGRFGYIISGHNSQKDGVPKFYNYSCNIDTACYHTGKLTAIIYGERGREDLLTFTGKRRFPDLDQMMIDMANGLV
jgi:predicted phosphodiesterase